MFPNDLASTVDRDEAAFSGFSALLSALVELGLEAAQLCPRPMNLGITELPPK